MSVDFREMNRVLEVHAEDLDCVIEPGVTRKQLDKALANTGTAFWVDPVEDICAVFMTQLLPSDTYPIRRRNRTGSTRSPCTWII